jgi:hypothetical protein
MEFYPMRSVMQRAVVIVIASSVASGCGIAVPEIKELWDADFPAKVSPNGVPIRPKLTGAAQIEYEIVKRVYCDLKAAVFETMKYPVYESKTIDGKRTRVQTGVLPKNWGAQVALSLQVDESASLNPGLTLNDYFANAVKTFGVGNTVTVAQTFNLGLGATVSSTATRTDKFNPYWSVAFLMEPYKSDIVCENEPFAPEGLVTAKSSPLRLESDLGIADWLLGSSFVNVALPSAFVRNKSGAATKAESISYELKFIIVSNGSITPTWKLVKLSANTGSNPLFATGRTRTHDLIITMGPETEQTANAHLASQIGNAVANANRAIFVPQ